MVVFYRIFMNIDPHRWTFAQLVRVMVTFPQSYFNVNLHPAGTLYSLGPPDVTPRPQAGPTTREGLPGEGLGNHLAEGQGCLNT